MTKLKNISKFIKNPLAYMNCKTDDIHDYKIRFRYAINNTQKEIQKSIISGDYKSLRDQFGPFDPIVISEVFSQVGYKCSCCGKLFQYKGYIYSELMNLDNLSEEYIIKHADEIQWEKTIYDPSNFSDEILKRMSSKFKESKILVKPPLK